LNPHVYLGAFFIYEFGFLPDAAASLCQSGGGLSCDVHDISFGANVQFHTRPGARFDPWIGAGVGYERLSLSASANGRDASLSASGFQLLDLQIGGDVRFSPSFALGPFVSLSFGQYGSVSGSDALGNRTSAPIADTAVHEWLLIVCAASTRFDAVSLGHLSRRVLADALEGGANSRHAVIESRS
jgi:hypothetical protein